MAGITLSQAQAQLDSWLGLLTKLSQSTAASVEFENRRYTSKDLTAVQGQVTYWERRVKELDAAAAGRNRSRRVIPAW